MQGGAAATDRPGLSDPGSGGAAPTSLRFFSWPSVAPCAAASASRATHSSEAHAWLPPRSTIAARERLVHPRSSQRRLLL
jgi:hypothetical protein